MKITRTNWINNYGKGTYSSDDKRKAKPPGERISKKGNPYYESRKNRSDSYDELGRYSRYSISKHKREQLKEIRKEKAKVTAAKKHVEKTKKKNY